MSLSSERHGLHSTQKYAKVLRFGSFAFFVTALIFKALKKLFFSFKPSQIQLAHSRFKSSKGFTFQPNLSFPAVVLNLQLSIELLPSAQEI